MDKDDTRPFWERKSLAQMTRGEWESLCDGCGQCCLIKLEDVDSGDLVYTGSACAWLDCESCRCRDYDNRRTNVPDCVALDPVNIYDLYWLPETCAYGLLARGQSLPGWHPLLSGDPQSVHRAGMSVRGWARPEPMPESIPESMPEPMPRSMPAPDETHADGNIRSAKQPLKG